MLTERLREQFINLVKHDSLKRKLLEAEDDSLDDLLKRARTFEQVDAMFEHPGKLPAAIRKSRQVAK